MVITGVIARVPDKIKSLIYVDAFVPEDGKAVIDYIAPERHLYYDFLAQQGKSIPPIPLDVMGLTDPLLVEFVFPRLTDQPWRTFYEPVHACHLPPDVSVGYVYCSGPHARFNEFYKKLKGDLRVQTAVIDTSHFCMLSEPLKTTEILARFG
jgi:hypothetical protein